MTGRDSETMLRDALVEKTRDVVADTSFVNATVDHSIATLRTTRRRQWAIGAGAVAAVAALVVWQAPAMVDTGSHGPITQPTQQPPQTVANATDWAMSLPRGADAQVAYFDGHTFVTGSTQTDFVLDRTGSVLAPLPGGWLADLVSIDASGRPAKTVYGEFRPDGSFLPYAYQPVQPALTGIAASPDGSHVAFGTDIVATGYTPGGGFDQATSGTKVGQLPPQAAAVTDWRPGGLVFQDAKSRYWLWPQRNGQSLPSGPPIRQKFDGYADGGFGYVQEGGCVRVGPPSVPEFITGSYKLCDEGTPLTVSSDNLALMSYGEFVNLEAGVDFMSIPVGVIPEHLQLFWESDDSLILVVQNTTSGNHGPTPVVLVRCAVTAGRCERASDPLSNYPQLAAFSGLGR